MDAPLCKLCGERHWNWGECQRIQGALASARVLLAGKTNVFLEDALPKPKKKRGPRGSFDRHLDRWD
jgi:hypothetical protein